MGLSDIPLFESRDLWIGISDTHSKLTLARTYIGLDVLIAGNDREALKYFQWVTDSGDKTSQEFIMSLILRRRIEGVNTK